MPAGIEPAGTEYHDYNRLINEISGVLFAPLGNIQNAIGHDPRGEFRTGEFSDEASGVLFAPLGNIQNAIGHFGCYRSSLKYATPRLSGA